MKRTSEFSSEELEERKKKRNLYMKNCRAKLSKQTKETRFQQVRQHTAEVRASESEHAREVRFLLGKVSTDTNNEFSIERALRIYPTNDQVAKHNEKVLRSFEKRGIAIYTIKAQDQLIDATRNLDNKDLNSVITNNINKTGGLPNMLKIFEGAKVEHRRTSRFSEW